MKAVIYPKEKKVACVLLQAIYGGCSSVPSLYFDSHCWALAPPQNDDGIMVDGTPEQWKILAEQWNAKSKKMPRFRS